MLVRCHLDRYFGVFSKFAHLSTPIEDGSEHIQSELTNFTLYMSAVVRGQDWTNLKYSSFRSTALILILKLMQLHTSNILPSVFFFIKGFIT